MRELTVRIKFTQYCLGDVNERRSQGTRYLFLRTPDGHVMFLSTWHQQNMRLAARLLGRHDDEVDKILWDVAVGETIGQQCWHRRWYGGHGGTRRYVFHEAFYPGRTVSLNCVVPATITDDDVMQLLNLAGRYKGLSPFKPGEFGRFEVVDVRPSTRRAQQPEDAAVKNDS